MDRPSLDGGARGYPPREGGREGDSGGEMPERAEKRFPGVERLFEEPPPTWVMGEPAAGCAVPEA